MKTTGNNPLIQFEPGGGPLNINLNLQQSSTYFGRSFLELNFGDEEKQYFKAELYNPSKHETATRGVTPSIISALLEKSRKPEMSIRVPKNRDNSDISGNVEETSEAAALASINRHDWWTVGVHNLSKRLQNIDLAQLEAEAGRMGYRTTWYRNHFGALEFYLTPSAQSSVRPRLYIIESYRLSSFETQYGAGRTLKTFTLLPGEKTRISIRTFKHRQTEENYASCILDSVSHESAHEFQSCIDSENQMRQEFVNTMEFITSTEVDPPLYGCSINTFDLNQINFAREEFTKNIWKAMTKHTSRAASKREININTETAVKTELGEDEMIVREIANPNMGRTVNYVFRQLNQEFLSVLYLTDVRIGFTNGYFRKEYTLPELDQMLEELVFDEMRDEVRSYLTNAILSIRDIEGNSIRNTDAIRQVVTADSPSALKTYQFNASFCTDYKDESGLEYCIPGVVIATNRFVMPTDSVMADSILGQGDILDTHIRNMQNEELRERVLNNDMKAKEVEKMNLAESIVKESATEKAKTFEEVFARFDNNFS